MALARHWFVYLPVAALALGLCGCRQGDRTVSAASRAGSGPRAVVEQYLQAASRADGASMYALIAGSERDDESPTTLADTARDRYSTGATWDVLKTEPAGTTAKVIVELKGAKVDPNPTTFTLTQENGEWRIVDSPELHERDKNGGIHIKL
ncbi:MAG TPA: hypothetical protein VFU47_14020 [Armatimonadota bacterium]|nr:hypothetical protein [Armatimonadota bacterium]